MILIADSGSTKTEWRILEKNKSGKSFRSAGINPFFMNSDEIVISLRESLGEIEDQRFSKIYFYGAGCNGVQKETVSRALDIFFQCKEIVPSSDLLGAARSLCQDEPGIACIMGTGSNSCYYNGKKIVANVAPLGYILGDEGGGAVLGRKLVSAVLKKQVSKHVIDLFFDTHKIAPAEILENVYMKPFPNRFLGQFAKFIHENSFIPEISEIIVSSFEEFVKRNILQYPESRSLPVHFTGSIAFHFSNFLENSLRNNGLVMGNITISPIDNLVTYHARSNN